MRPTFLGFETQKRTLQVAQKNLDITGNNLSNTNTVGYTRQRVDLYAMYVSGNRSLRWCSQTNNLSVSGQGVNAYGVSQIRDMYIDKRYRENVAIEAETEKTVAILSEVEDVLDNFETDGLLHFTEQFFKALQDYSVEKPDGSEVATFACNTAVNLCRLLNDYDNKLCEVEDTYVAEMEDTVFYLNNLLDDMNILNDRIARELLTYPEGYGPNELYDQLNMYIDELSNYGDVSITENRNGTFDVTLCGIKVVDGNEFKVNHLIMEDYESYNQAIIYYESGEEMNCQNGVIKSFYNMLNGNGVYATGSQNGEYGIAYFKSAVNEFASTLARVFNSCNGGYEDPSRMMFEPTVEGATITAGNIHVSDAWLQNPTMIGEVRSLDPITGMYQYGFDSVTNEDGTVTLQNTNVIYLLSQFENTNIKFGNAHDFQGSFYQYISFVSNRLAQTITYDKSRYDGAVTTVDTLLDARDEVSGVDMDEEGINMLNYQKWYSASSRMLTALDDCLDKLINSTGRVGL
ncbi:MAG: flagellar hook-associated protein FlgK [Oscillospiraceae bacterium]|nr:flagellar hook-associated protein FlgK [Oscillospiraceae bacterium]